MNSIWNKNIRLFCARFPGLYDLNRPLFSDDSNGPALPPDWELPDAKQGGKTLRENGIWLHSAYNPAGEAEKAAAALIKPDRASSSPLVFYGFGLGYGPIAAARLYPGSPLALIEPDARRFACALRVLDWEPVLSHPRCVLLINAAEQSVLSVLEDPLLGETSLKSMVFVDLPILQRHDQGYFAALKELVKRNIWKQQVNQNTKKKFSVLWERNRCRNAARLTELRGVRDFAGIAQDRPACVVAAGPSLEGILPHLRALQARCVLICVDTALRSVLRAGVEPDFIVLGDAQFWNARHLDGLAAPAATLVTEIAAYPSVFRFPCKEIVLFDSVHPALDAPVIASASKGALGAGGSVAATAWDFARLLDCPDIYLAALDLGFPARRSHARGSTFECQSHRESARLDTAETFGVRAIYSANTSVCADYMGNPLLSDERMNLYAWWFESKAASFPQHKTWSLTAESRAIPGVEYLPVERLEG
ncbi:MAG: DUF115 domain-containing protein [Treponema sp.]|nr:DUF115 domain-containing protein [Treponema sp.]